MAVKSVKKKLDDTIVQKENKPTHICCEAYNMAANIVCYCTSLLIAVNDQKKPKYYGQQHKTKHQKLADCHTQTQGQSTERS